MSKETKNPTDEQIPQVNYVQYCNNIQGVIAAFQPSITSPAKVVKLTMDVNNISVCIVDDIQYFKFSAKEVDEALLKYRLDLEKDIDHKEVVNLFGDLHDMLDKVHKRTYYMNNGSVITTFTSPHTDEVILTDDGQYFVMTASMSDWWMKNTGIKTIVEAIRQHIPDFSPWKGTKDTIVGYLTDVRDKRSALLPKKHS
ncbi:hypothetical protein Silverhawkium_gp99 [Shigella phage Silverhawkium]|uniref:Uncharacterized protein n=1 Tax=Shigella phage Silverhawkium TaxID=2530185 RepID=A0A482JGW7_9CAUD|nr:hypothetical protein Silverhawkium_gp99 [Shigella phage Silverhawkium]